MKYILIIGTGAIVIGVLLAICVDFFFGDWVSSFFAKFIAGPIGLGISFVIFIIYDSYYPKQKELSNKNQRKDKIET